MKILLDEITPETYDRPCSKKYFAKGPVKLMQRVKIAHSFLQYVSNQFRVIISSLPT